MEEDDKPFACSFAGCNMVSSYFSVIKRILIYINYCKHFFAA